MDTPKITPKLFLAMYAVILLPLLVLNILVSQWNLDRVTDREEKQIQAKLDKISVELTELHATYNSKATQIYSKSALSYRNMVGNFATAQAGADLLKDLAILDDRTCDFYMYYHTAEMFAARGYSHTDVFFGSQLFASKDTFDSAMTAIDAESPVAFLVNRKDYTNSYMIYHYPVTFGDQAGITATGFVFTLNTIMESFPDVIDLPYILRISDSIAGASYRLAGGHASPLPPAQYESAKKTKADWQYYKSYNESLGLTVELLYPYEAIATETRESQYWNYGLLLLGTICSAVLALILARISWKKLKEMEEFAKGEKDVKFPKRFDEYSGLREILRARMAEFAASREYAKLTKIDNKAQLMRLLLAGMFTSQAEFSDAAKRCGLMMLQTHYFVIGVLVPNPDAMSQLDTLLEHDLTCHITVGESETPAMLLVAELSSEDFALSERIRLSNELKDVMHDHNLPIVQLAFSAVYDALDMAPFAVREVRDVLTRQSATYVPDHGKGPLRRAGDGDDDLQKADELRGRDLPVAREHPGHQDDLLYRQGDRPVRGPQLRLHARQRAGQGRLQDDPVGPQRRAQRPGGPVRGAGRKARRDRENRGGGLLARGRRGKWKYPETVDSAERLRGGDPEFQDS